MEVTSQKEEEEDMFFSDHSVIFVLKVFMNSVKFRRLSSHFPQVQVFS